MLSAGVWCRAGLPLTQRGSIRVLGPRPESVLSFIKNNNRYYGTRLSNQQAINIDDQSVFLFSEAFQPQCVF